MKKLLLIAMRMMCVSSLVFAGGKAEEQANVEKGLNIAIITTPSGVDDGSFN